MGLKGDQNKGEMFQFPFSPYSHKFVILQVLEKLNSK